mmetsp:Transcript_2654/g.8077  ORF Transcript_2654/g.8077 Transcript_2654/m.8077 type:complete len:303 (-) Transcript_2654:56-964(-)
MSFRCVYLHGMLRTITVVQPARQLTSLLGTAGASVLAAAASPLQASARPVKSLEGSRGSASSASLPSLLSDIELAEPLTGGAGSGSSSGVFCRPAAVAKGWARGGCPGRFQACGELAPPSAAPGGGRHIDGLGMEAGIGSCVTLAPPLGTGAEGIASFGVGAVARSFASTVTGASFAAAAWTPSFAVAAPGLELLAPPSWRRSSATMFCSRSKRRLWLDRSTTLSVCCLRTPGVTSQGSSPPSSWPSSWNSRKVFLTTAPRRALSAGPRPRSPAAIEGRKQSALSMSAGSSRSRAGGEGCMP